MIGYLVIDKYHDPVPKIGIPFKPGRLIITNLSPNIAVCWDIYKVDFTPNSFDNIRCDLGYGYLTQECIVLELV